MLSIGTSRLTDYFAKALSKGLQKEQAVADAVVGMEEHSMRKVISDLDEEERQALLVLADFGSASFSAGLVVEVLRLFINLIT
jgi:dihydroxyacetone kinase DhaKLM complex PTS-EIIA-like component DhaM